ncbi:MAG TPA: flagellar hook capping FlgD N-terminal domain-containing protein [Tepidisphaeraceae bacterium]|nr:flagellar hook capping FlgD N-terminal domain-containing protein [Tepidisphaeraceae bacterium]
MSSLTGLIPTAVANGTTSTTASTSNQFNSLSPSDFVQMMVTQLQNQDPMDPTNSQDILSQMSSIGQLESSDQLQSTLTSMTLQNQISSASSLIGKPVSGTDSNGNNAMGTVNSITVQQIPANLSASGVATTNVVLNIQNNGVADTMPLANVQSIGSPTATAASAVPSALTAAAATVQAAASGALNTASSLASSALAPIVSIAPN